MGGCLHEATWLQAEARCRQYGARLCTRHELPVNQRSGCGHDSEYVWAWEECAHQTPPFVCAQEGASCQCLGTVYYGQRYDPGSGAEITTLEAMSQFTTFNQSSSTSLPCTNAQFGDPAPSAEKQCICELSTITQEKRVAANGAYIEDYRCDLWTERHAVRCCADVAPDVMSVAFHNALLAHRGSIREKHDVLTWLQKLEKVSAATGMTPEEVLAKWNQQCPEAARIVGNKRMCCLNLLKHVDAQWRNLLVDHASQYGKNSAFVDDAFTLKKVLPGYKPRCASAKWVQLLTVTQRSFGIMLKHVIRKHENT